VVNFWSPGKPGLQGGSLPADAVPVPVALVNGTFPGPPLNLVVGQVSPWCLKVACCGSTC
jgi:hypothetical protein